jgi:DNA-binding PucR family transcriptional regulator
VSGVVTGGGERGWRESGEASGGNPEDGGSGSPAFVEQWLESLIAHDARCGSELTATLSEFLEHNGKLGAAASAMGIHRSTLRYRLFRIHELTGYDIHDTATRSLLLRAIRVWRAR